MPNYDVKLTKTDGSSNEVQLTLDRGTESGGYAVEHISPAPPNQATDAANYQQQSPDLGLVLDQDSFHRGFGQALLERFDDASSANAALSRYAYSEGVLGMFKGELVLGYKEDEVNVLLRNGTFENGGVSEWTASNVTTAVETTTVRSGSYSLKATVTANSGTVSQEYGGTDAVLRSREVTLVAFVRRESGSGTITAKITDSAGTTTGTSSTSAAGSAWEAIYATRTIDSSATSITFTLTASTDEDVFYIDDISVTPSGGVDWTTPQEFNGNVYAACGRVIYKWDDSNEVFNAVYADSTYNVTDMISFNGALYAGFGTNQVYLRSTDGSTWAAPSTNTGNGRFAEFFERARNASGNYALFKNRANNVSISTDPSDTANWGTEISVGDSDRSITSLVSANDILYVGREDGLFSYDRATQKFRDLQPEANFFPDSNNFKASTGRAGQLFASGGDQSFWQIGDGFFDGAKNWTDLSYLFKAAGIRGFGGRVSAVAQDRNNLFVALADDLEGDTGFPYTFPFQFAGSGKSQAVKLIGVRTQRESPSDSPEQVAHTISSFSVSEITAMGKFKGTEAVRTSMFVMGNKVEDDLAAITNDTVVKAYRLRMPIRNENPALNSLSEHRLTGNFYTSYVNFNFPDVDKSAIKITVTGRNLDSNKKATVFYKVDDATDDDTTGWTTFGSSGECTSSSTTLTSSIQLNFKRIRFKVVLSTNDSAQSPIITGFVFHSAWNPIEYRRWSVQAKLSDKRSLAMRRVRNKTLRTADLNNLETLRKEPFILYTDLDGSSHYVSMRYRDELIKSRVQSTRNVQLDQTRRLILELTEVKTT
tara:strand:+ start:18344 stop:20809 length:2466 start_codon:yes stop_codon:yes gene_type:complete